MLSVHNNNQRLQDYEGTQRVPDWDGECRGNSGGNEDERGNEGHVHRVNRIKA